jgi:hypothetical protein
VETEHKSDFPWNIQLCCSAAFLGKLALPMLALAQIYGKSTLRPVNQTDENRNCHILV